jgi:hypothetical protein
MPGDSYTADELDALEDLGRHTRRDVTHLVDVCQLSLREFTDPVRGGGSRDE